MARSKSNFQPTVADIKRMGRIIKRLEKLLNESGQYGDQQPVTAAIQETLDKAVAHRAAYANKVVADLKAKLGIE